MFRVVSFSRGVSSERNTRSVATVMLLAVRRAMACASPRGVVAPRQLAVLFQRLVEPGQFLLQSRGDHELSARGGIRVRILRHQPPPCGDGRLPLFLVEICLAEQIEDRGVTRVQRILGKKRTPELSRRVVLLGLMLLRRHQVLGLDELPLHLAPGFVRRVQPRYSCQVASASENFFCSWYERPSRLRASGISSRSWCRSSPRNRFRAATASS